MLAWTEGLWKEAHEVAHIHAEDIDGLKAVFGGETFPQGYKNVVSCTGVYVDTNILPDPFLRSDHVLKGSDDSAAVRSFVTSVLSLLQYKDAALAEIDIPLVAIVPDLMFLDEFARERVFVAADDDTLMHLNAIFGASFKTLREAEDFLSELETSENVVRNVADPGRLLFDLADVGPLETRIDNYIKNFVAPFGLNLRAGQAIFASTIGRMRQANDLLLRSATLRGSPLIDAPTSWRYFNWTLGYRSTQHRVDHRLNLHMTKALQTAASGEMEWLGAVPVAALVEMRKQDVLPELRSMLSDRVGELIELRPDNFHRTGDQVLENIQKAFDEHRKKISTLTGKKWRFAGVELGSCIVKGAVQVASACGVPGVSLIGTALDQAMDVPKVKDIPNRFRAIRSESKELRNSAVGMLFQVAQARK